MFDTILPIANKTNDHLSPQFFKT